VIVRVGVLALAGLLQMGQLDGSGPAKAKSYVAYGAEPQAVIAGKKSLLELKFVVNDGFHVNSHTPKSELLIPTNLTLKPADGVKAAPVEYPKGQAYSFSFDPSEKLDVYSGAFSVKVPVEAAKGEHTVDGVLRYQACDHAACYPPKSLPVSVVFTAK
jgi:hypothetical protein